MCFDAPFSSKNQGNPETKQDIYILSTHALTQHGNAEYFRKAAPTPLNTSALRPSLTPKQLQQRTHHALTLLASRADRRPNRKRFQSLKIPAANSPPDAWQALSGTALTALDVPQKQAGGCTTGCKQAREPPSCPHAKSETVKRNCTRAGDAGAQTYARRL